MNQQTMVFNDIKSLIIIWNRGKNSTRGHNNFYNDMKEKLGQTLEHRGEMVEEKKVERYEYCEVWNDVVLMTILEFYFLCFLVHCFTHRNF